MVEDISTWDGLTVLEEKFVRMNRLPGSARLIIFGGNTGRLNSVFVEVLVENICSRKKTRRKYKFQPCQAGLDWLQAVFGGFGSFQAVLGCFRPFFGRFWPFLAVSDHFKTIQPISSN